MKSIFFFATPKDIRQVLRRFEGNGPLKYVEGGMRLSPERNVCLESNDIVDLGIATHETGSLSARYMVCLRNTEANVRTMTMRNGVKRWDLDNVDTPGSIMLTPAGKWKDMLLAGNVRTLHADPVAQTLMKNFQSALKAEGFARAGVFWLSREALEMLDAGRRLSTTAEQSPPEFDLRSEFVKRPSKKGSKPAPSGGLVE